MAKNERQEVNKNRKSTSFLPPIPKRRIFLVTQPFGYVTQDVKEKSEEVKNEEKEETRSVINDKFLKSFLPDIDSSLHQSCNVLEEEKHRRLKYNIKKWQVCTTCLNLIYSHEQTFMYSQLSKVGLFWLFSFRCLKNWPKTRGEVARQWRPRMYQNFPFSLINVWS